MLKIDQKIKKKHHSKKKKAAWRKHTDIADVENFLEEQINDEIHVGDLTQQKDEDLFMVDDKIEEPLSELKLTKKELRKLKAQREPRSTAALKNTSKVQDPIIKRNRVRTKEERMHPIAKSKKEAKAAEGILPLRVKQSLEDKARDKKMKNKKKEVQEFSKDLWEDDNPVPKEFQVQWYEKHTVEHHLRNLGKPMVRTPNETHKKRSQLKSVQVPHPGASYNPTFDDHQELVEEVTKKEEEIMKREERLDRLTSKKFTKLTPAQLEKQKQKELIQGLPIDKSKENRQTEEASDDEYRATNPPVRNKKKDRKARRKQLEAKKRREEENIQKQEVKKVKDINKVPLLKKEILTHEKEVEKKHKNHEKRLKEKKVNARRIGRMKFREPEIDVNQLEDISGNMRNLKPEGNLLLDRFKSLQKRNILPSGTLRKVRRKTMVKKYIKKSHKGEDIKTKNKIKPPKSAR